MCVYLFLSLPAKTNMPMLLSEPKGMEQFTIQPASCPLPCGFGKCQGEKKKKIRVRILLLFVQILWS